MSEPRLAADLLISGASALATLTGPPGPLRGAAAGDLGLLEDASLAACQGRIIAVGPRGAVEARIDLLPGANVVDARGFCVVPGFVDPHTHLVYGGDRADEYALRQRGASYLEILAAGGGILSTVQRTRAASGEALYATARARLDRMLALGTTTVEIKSGYGLDLDHELGLLAVADRLRREGPARVVPTVLGAHALPAQFGADRAAYLDMVCERLIPSAASQGLALFNDVFCEEGAFSLEESERVLRAGLKHGLRAKLHADQLSAGGGAQLAARLNAVSADHLDFADDDGLAALAAAGVVSVLLPGASLVLRHREHASGRRFIAAGVGVALATDHNPGTCPIESLPLIMSLACALLGLTPAEALVATTRNAACAVGLEREIGSLEVGKRADLLLVDAPAPHYLAYRFGVDLVRTVIVDGRVVVAKENRS
ncbi:MAG: imidazolonepropionase [Chloroflexota bacterium]